MATRNTRDVTLSLSVETLGEENVQRLKQSVLALAKEGGDAAPEFQRLADEIERIGTQGDALRSFQQLSIETAELREKQLATAASAEKLAAELETLRATTAAAKQEQTSATRALTDGRLANVEAGNAIRLLKTEYDAAGKNTQEYRDRLRELTQQQGEARSNLVELTQASRDANKAAADAEREQAKVEKQYRTTTAASEQLARQLREQETSLKSVADAAQALGVATDDIAGAEAALLQELNRAGRAAKERTESIREMTEADRLLAIEERGLEELLKRGQVALDAESAAQRDAAAAVRSYAEAKEQAARDAEAWQREADAIVDAAEAARKLEAQTRATIEERRALMEQELRDKMLEEAAAAAELAARMRVWTQAMEEADRQSEETAAAARRLDEAFDSIGIRSAQELTREIQRIREAMRAVADSGQLTGNQLKVAFASGERQIQALERELRELNGTLRLSDQAAKLFRNSMGQIAVGNLIADGIASIIERVKEMGRQFIEVTVRTERLQRSLQAIYKDTALAEQQFEVLRNAAGRAGVSVNAITDSFVRFSASTKSAGIEVKVANELFENLTLAGASLGLTSDSVAGALDALSQMASKGVVSMEELRQQLGDRLPGALGLSAKGLGITEQQLIKMVEQGNLATEQFFPAFARALRAMHGDTNTLAGNWARLVNLLTSFTQATAAAGGIDVLRGALKALGVALGAILLPLQGFIEALTLTGKAIGAFFAGLSSGDMKGAFAAFQDDLLKSGERLRALQKGFADFVTGQNAATEAANNTSTALQGQTSAMLAASAAQESLGVATGQTGNAYVQSLVKMSENTAAIEASIVAAEKLAKAKQTEGRALIDLARLTGDANAEMQAAVKVSQDNILASKAVVVARRREVATLQESIAVIQAEGARRGKLTDAMRLQIAALTENLEKQSAALEAAKQTAAELDVQAVAVKTLAHAYRDNSSSVDAFKSRMDSLGQTANSLKATISAQEEILATLRAEVDAGRASQALYDDALKNLEATKREYLATLKEAAAAEALYRDAVKDAVDNLERKTAAEVASLEVGKASLLASEARYKAMAALAKVNKDSELAIYAEMQARKARMQVMELELKIEELEIAAKRKGIEIQLAAIRGIDDESRAKREQLQIELQLLDAKQALLKVKAEEIREFRAGTREIELNNEARRRGVETTREMTSATRELIKAEADLRGGRTADGFSTNAEGKKLVAGTEVATRLGAANFLRSAGVTDEAQIQRIIRELSDSQGNIDARRGNLFGYGEGATSMVLMRAAEKVLFDKRGVPQAGSGGAFLPTGGVSPPGAVGSAPKTVNINISGRTTPVNVASDADAQALVGVLRQLETQSNAAA